MFNNSNHWLPSLLPLSSSVCALYVEMLSSPTANYGAMASLWVPLVVVRDINCGRAVNYSSGGLKGLEPTVAPVRHTFISQSVPMGPLFVRSERPQPGNINDLDPKKRWFCVQEERKKMNRRREIQRERVGREREKRDIMLGISHKHYVLKLRIEECLAIRGNQQLYTILFEQWNKICSEWIILFERKIWRYSIWPHGLKDGMSSLEMDFDTANENSNISFRDQNIGWCSVVLKNQLANYYTSQYDQLIV